MQYKPENVCGEYRAKPILIELVGFWHPDYLPRKVEKVCCVCRHLLLLVYKGLNIAEDAFQDVASEVIFFPAKAGAQKGHADR